MKLKIGITGGIGSGKTAVAKIIRSAGYPVLDADTVAKDIMDSDPKVKKSITAEFGSDAYKNNKLNTSFLGTTVFNSPEQIQKINSIVHPPTILKISEIMGRELEGEDLVFVEAALIFESNMDEILDYVLLVTAPEELRISRTILRDSLQKTEILQRMKFQMPESEKENLADFVIKNTSSLIELEEKTKFFVQLFNFMSNTKH